MHQCRGWGGVGGEGAEDGVRVGGGRDQVDKRGGGRGGLTREGEGGIGMERRVVDEPDTPARDVRESGQNHLCLTLYQLVFDTVLTCV